MSDSRFAMKPKYILFWVLTCGACAGSAMANGRVFCAGQWDSTLYNFSDRPRTVVLRVVIEDDDTRRPLPGVEVALEGECEADPVHGGFRMTEEFYLPAMTGRSGIAIFALSWTESESPGMDDIRKVAMITARKDGYRFISKSMDLSSLTQESEGWKRLLRDTPGAKYFLPQFSPRFTDYNNPYCRHPALFVHILRQQYGMVLSTEHDSPAPMVATNSPGQAGPYMMLPVVLHMERIQKEHRLISPQSPLREKPPVKLAARILL